MKILTSRLWKYRHNIKSRTIDMTIVGLGVGMVRIFTFITAMLVARVAGATTFGEYSFFSTVFVFVSEMTSALDTAFIAQNISSEQVDSESKYVVVLLLAKLLFTLVLCLIALTASDFLAQFFFGKSQIAPILLYGIISGGIYSVSSTLISLYQKRRQFIKMSLLRALPNLSLLLAVSFVVVIGCTLTGKFIGNVYLIVSCFLAFGTVILLIKKLLSFYKMAFKRLPSFYQIGGVLVVSNALLNFASRLDVFFLTPVITFQELGIYGAAVRYSAVAGIITGVITTIILPKAPLALNGGKKTFNRYIFEAVIYWGLQGILICGLILYMDFLIQIMFGAEYLSMKWLAILLLAQVFISSVGVPFQALLQCSRRPSIVLFLSSARLLVAFVLLKILVPLYGAVGGAIAMVSSTCFLTIIMIFFGLMAFKSSNRMTV